MVFVFLLVFSFRLHSGTNQSCFAVAFAELYIGVDDWRTCRYLLPIICYPVTAGLCSFMLLPLSIVVGYVGSYQVRTFGITFV